MKWSTHFGKEIFDWKKYIFSWSLLKLICLAIIFLTGLRSSHGSPIVTTLTSHPPNFYLLSSLLPPTFSLHWEKLISARLYCLAQSSAAITFTLLIYLKVITDGYTYSIYVIRVSATQTEQCKLFPVG